MRVIAFKTLRDFWEKAAYSDSEISLRGWYHEAKKSEWKNSNELKQHFKNASILGEGRAVFNIKGNSYRLVVAIDYEFQVIFIRFVGTINSTTTLMLKQFNYGNQTYKNRRRLQLFTP